MPAELEVSVVSGRLDFQIEAEWGERFHHVKFDRHMTSALVVMTLQGFGRRPPRGGELLLDPARQSLKVRPSFQVAIDRESGDAPAGFPLHLLSALHFLFDDGLASKLARELSEILVTLRPARIQRINR